MIYNGKEYKVIPREGAKIGDLVHITALDDNDCDIHEFITWIDDEYDIHFNRCLPDGSRFVYKGDTFKTYRYVKDVEETPVKFKSGDRVKVVGYSGSSRKITNGRVGEFMYVNDFGECSVLLDGGAQLSFPPETLKLVEETPVEAIKGASVYHVISRSNDAIDAMHYGFEKLGKTLKRPSLSDNVNDLFTEIKDIIVAKNENYGDSFSKQYKKYGMISVEMRLNDKMMRLEQLVKGEKDKVGESVEDTLKDIIGYATLALIELECEK